jgi:GT2 family glycosyltransferase
MSVPSVSIIIVNWNSLAFLRKCLFSIRQLASDVSHEVIVVDNASFDGSREMVANEFREVRFIQSQSNLGFSRANNLGVESSTGRNLLFLNPDTEFRGSALKTLLEFIESRQDVGIVGAKLLNSDMTVQLGCVKAFPSLLNQLIEWHHLMERYPRWKLWGMAPLFDHSDEPAVVEVVSGACLLIKRHVFSHVGGFGTQYFMYSEDVDLCHKVKAAGWKAFLVERAEVVHHGGRSSTLAPVSQFAAVLIRESRFRFLKDARGIAYAASYRALTGILAASRLVVLTLVLPFAYLRRRALPVGAMAKWSKILRWSIGLESWVRGVG